MVLRPQLDLNQTGLVPVLPGLLQGFIELPDRPAIPAKITWPGPLPPNLAEMFDRKIKEGRWRSGTGDTILQLEFVFGDKPPPEIILASPSNPSSE